jgi:hypothetical protein
LPEAKSKTEAKNGGVESLANADKGVAARQQTTGPGDAMRETREPGIGMLSAFF